MVLEDHRKPTAYGTKTLNFLVDLEFGVEVFAVLLGGACGIFRKTV